MWWQAVNSNPGIQMSLEKPLDLTDARPMFFCNLWKRLTEMKAHRKHQVLSPEPPCSDGARWYLPLGHHGLETPWDHFAWNSIEFSCSSWAVSPLRPVCPGSAPGSSPNWLCPEYLQREPARGQPKQMSKPPQLAPVNAKEQWLNTEWLVIHVDLCDRVKNISYSLSVTISHDINIYRIYDVENVLKLTSY